MAVAFFECDDSRLGFGGLPRKSPGLEMRTPFFAKASILLSFLDYVHNDAETRSAHRPDSSRPSEYSSAPQALRFQSLV